MREGIVVEVWTADPDRIIAVVKRGHQSEIPSTSVQLSSQDSQGG
jgi:hypothetical protein